MRRTLILAFVALVLVGIIAFFAFLLQSPADDTLQPEESRGGLGSLFPFNFGAGPDPEQGGEGEGSLFVDDRPVPVLREVSSEPTVGGYVYLDEEDAVMIRYIDRATGHVFEANTDNLSSVRISNTTIPEIQHVLFIDENTFIIQYLNENEAVENFYIELEPGAEEQSIQGDFLRGWARGSVDTKNGTVFTVEEVPGGSAVRIADADGTGERLLLQSPVRSWVPLQSESSLYVHEAPSSGALGSLFEIVSGELRTVVRGVEGMVAVVSPSGRYALISGGERNNLTLTLFDLNTGERHGGIFETIATKCVFVSETPVQVICGAPNEVPSAEYPNDWLLGRVQFDDDVWLIEPTNNVATLIAVPRDDVGRAIDVWKPMVDPTGTYLSFINKRDLSFWTLRLQPEEPAVSTENAEEASE